MIQLIIDNVFTEIKNASKETEMKIWDKLSFEIKEFNVGPYHAPKYRHCFNRKTKLTYTGLLQYVIDILNDNDEEYEITDNRVKPETNADFHLVEYLDDNKTIKLEARDYQKNIVTNASNREIVQAATGAGKTFIMAALIARFNVRPVSVFADKLSLCTQLQSEFSKFLGEDIGLVGGGVYDKKDITVYSAQSATEEDIQDTKLLMVDECLPGYARVMDDKGSYATIADIVDNNKLDMVMSYNTDTRKFEPQKIINRMKKQIEDRRMVKIKVKRNDYWLIIECTNNHKIWEHNTQSYMRADELSIANRVIVYDNGEPLISKIESIEYIETDDEYVYDITVENNHNFVTNDVLVSNCHHTPSNTIAQISRWCTNAYYRIGVSATPWRDDGSDLLIDAVFSKKKEDMAINASYLIEHNYLVPCTIHWVHMKQVFKNRNYNNLYTEAIVNNKERNDAIVSIAYNMQTYKQATTLILIQRVAHGEKLLEEILKYIPVNTFTVTVQNPKNGKDTLVRVKSIEFLSGADDAVKRAAVIKAVKEKKCNILIASTIGDEGLDLPPLDTLILAGGGRSSTRAFQRVGRVLRLYTDPTTGKMKERANVFDFVDYTPILRRHSRTRDKMYHQEPAWDIENFPPHLLTLPNKLKTK